jgi:hypothetical protein
MTDAEVALAPWQRHNGRLWLSSVLAIAATPPLLLVAATPDGYDAWYLAIAIEFAVWGAINLLFSISGFRGVAQVRSLGAASRDQTALTKAREILRLLRVNAWLNLVWLTMGIALLIWGYMAWSPSLAGHGTSVLVQAIVLTILDWIFVRELSAAIPAGTD